MFLLFACVHHRASLPAKCGPITGGVPWGTRYQFSPAPGGVHWQGERVIVGVTSRSLLPWSKQVSVFMQIGDIPADQRLQREQELQARSPPSSIFRSCVRACRPQHSVETKPPNNTTYACWSHVL